MQTIDNRTHVWGTVKAVSAESDMPNFGELTLSIHRTASLPDFPDLLTALTVKELTIHVPVADLPDKALHTGRSVELVLEMASRTLAFARPGTLHLAKP